MSYWIGLSDSKQAQYEEEAKKKALLHDFFNAFKITKCYFCDQRVVMKLIKDSLSNSSGNVYAGKCPNNHWIQDIPGVPDDVRNVPRCKVCGGFMQYKLSIDFNGWICMSKHPKHP